MTYINNNIIITLLQDSQCPLASMWEWTYRPARGKLNSWTSMESTDPCQNHRVGMGIAWVAQSLLHLNARIHSIKYKCDNVITEFVMIWTYIMQFYYTPTTKCGGGYTGFALSRRSVGPSVRQSVGPSPILVRSITPLLLEGFPSNLNDTFTSTRGCTESVLPMCQVKVKVTVKGQIFNKQYYTLCCVRSITPLLMEGFPSNLNDTFTSTRGCAEPMLPMCQLKVKVTVKCQILNKQILDIM